MTREPMKMLSRRSLQRQIVREHIDAGVGEHHSRAIYDKMIADGDLTVSEVAEHYGYQGFYNSIIRPVENMRNAAGQDIYCKTKTGGVLQYELVDLDDHNRDYWVLKHHITGSEKRLEIKRQRVIDLHGVDPETLPDPFEIKDEEDEDLGDDPS